jgi:MHS family proline/betaine transporter-like MFS transporter
MRPIGGMMMGYIGDTYGSRKALTISIFLMAFPTFAMGCLPGYERVGSLSIVLLTIVRLLQGLSVGGQLISSLVFTLERHPKSKWGLYGSYVLAAANLGTLLGGLVATLVRRSLSDEALHSWGWRIPFLCGIVVSFSGYYLKRHGEDDDPRHIHGDDAPSNVPPPNPIRLAFSRSNMRSLLASSMITLLWSSGFYLTFVFMAVFMSDLIETPVPNSFAVNSASLLSSVCILFPVAGWLSDKVGRRRVMTVGGVAMGVLAPSMIALISSGNATTAFFSQFVLGVCLSLFGAPMMAWLAESFEPAARLTSVAVGYNIAQAVGGGMSPAIATELVDRYGPISPGFYITFMATISLLGLLCVAPRKPVHFTVLQGEDILGDFNNDESDDEDNELI